MSEFQNIMNDPRTQMAMRDSEIYRLRKEKNLSLRKLGKQFGISYERVRQIVAMLDERRGADPV